MGRLLGVFLQTIGALSLTIGLCALCAALFAGYWMRVDDPPVPSDYILPLAGDGHRLIKAAELYRQGYASTILISNAIIPPPTALSRLKWKIGYPRYTREQRNALSLKALGAETAKLESFGDGHISTVEEAEALRAHIGNRPIRLLIVTSPYHAKRAKMIFKEIMPESMISVVSTDEDSFSTQWWEDQRSAQNLIMEFAKTIHYLFGGVFRSTDAVAN